MYGTEGDAGACDGESAGDGGAGEASLQVGEGCIHLQDYFACLIVCWDLCEDLGEDVEGATDKSLTVILKLRN